MFAVLFVLKIYDNVKCTIYETVADNIEVLFVFMRYNHAKCTTCETVADNDCRIICIKEIQPRKKYNI